MLGPSRSFVMRWAIALALATAMIGGPVRVAHAGGDRVAALAETLTSSSNEKERISAVTALARLHDKRTLRPLVAALHDPSSLVRAIAAAGLGHLGHRAALPALRHAQDDPDRLVQRRAHAAVVEVSRANHIPLERPREPARPHAGFGHSPHAVAAHPEVYIVVKSTSDDSPGRANERSRKQNASIIRNELLGSLRAVPAVTSEADDASRYGLDPCHVDLSIVKLEQRTRGNYIEVEAELRLAISDGQGRMRSFLSNGAKVQVPRRTFNMRYLPQLRREALENAVRGIVDDLVAHLKRTAGT
jgi:HEAT repeats